MARKKKVKINPLPFKITGVLLLSLLVGFGAYKSITTFLTKSKYFYVRTVVIAPELGFIEKRDISWINNKNIFLIDLKEVKRKLVFKYPQIDNLKIIRRLPDQIYIKAEKRLPIAQIKVNSKILVLDSKAIILSLKSSKDDELPLIIGAREKGMRYSLGSSLNNREVRIAIKIIKAFKDTNVLSPYKMSDINVESLSKIEFTLNDKFKVILDKDRIERKIEMLGLILSPGRLDLGVVKYIDLRFKEPIVGKK